MSEHSSDPALISLFFGDFSAHVGSHLLNCEWDSLQRQSQAAQSSSSSTARQDAAAAPPWASNYPASGLLRGLSGSSSASSSTSSSARSIPRCVFIHQRGSVGRWHDLDGQLHGRDLHDILRSSSAPTSSSAFIGSLLASDGLAHAADSVELVDDGEAHDERKSTTKGSNMHATGSGSSACAGSSTADEIDYEQSSRSFTDFLQLPLSTRNFSLLDGSFFGVNAIDAFPEGRCQSGSGGGESSHWRKCLDSVIENVRYFSEESDVLNGFQLLVDVDSAWSGFSSTALETIRDDYGQKVPVKQDPRCSLSISFIFGKIFTVGISAPRKAKSGSLAADARRVLNESMSMHYLSEESTIYVPIDVSSFHSAQLFPSAPSSYSLSALVASLLHGQWTSHQVEDERWSMKKLAHLLAPVPAMKFISLSALAPAHARMHIWKVKDSQKDEREKQKASSASLPSSQQSPQYSLHDSPELLRLSPLHRVRGESFALASNKTQIALRDSDDEADDPEDADPQEDSLQPRSASELHAEDTLMSQAVIFRGAQRMSAEVKDACTLLESKLQLQKCSNRVCSHFAAPFLPPASFPRNLHAVGPMAVISELSNCRLTWRYLHSSAMKVKALRRGVSSLTAASMLTMTDAYGVLDQFVKEGVNKEEMAEVADALMSAANDYRDLPRG